MSRGKGTVPAATPARAIVSVEPLPTPVACGCPRKIDPPVLVEVDAQLLLIIPGIAARPIARPALQKQIANKALPETAYYTPLKQILKRVGAEINKQIFAKTVTKVVPVIGGVVSGGLTYASLRTGSGRLMKSPQDIAASVSQLRQPELGNGRVYRFGLPGCRRWLVGSPPAARFIANAEVTLL
jgi:hypothetical protein